MARSVRPSPLKWLIAEHYIALGLRIEPPPQPQWVAQASLVLAACEEGWDCCLDHRDEQWIFWRCYSCKIDDESLVSSVKCNWPSLDILSKNC
ncbi:hypothetical protein QWZ16_15385 [Vibrio ostreicida]|uniref:Uncharacterized protein n=1 Tax=Vibrio ostreicida TaxID=526588 RepID=A0ABT8BV57_9VIBR|nr:hypothetical protein [Vibrio ostreicida]MDN3611057.1 hypothetical protein [Vibrio ostreicida]